MSSVREVGGDEMLFFIFLMYPYMCRVWEAFWLLPLAHTLLTKDVKASLAFASLEVVVGLWFYSAP